MKFKNGDYVKFNRVVDLWPSTLGIFRINYELNDNVREYNVPIVNIKTDVVMYVHEDMLTRVSKKEVVMKKLKF